MRVRKGDFCEAATEELRRGKLREIAQMDPDFDNTLVRVEAARQEAIAAFLDKMEVYFASKTLEVMSGLKLFSIDYFRLNVASNADAHGFGKTEEDVLVKIYCRPYNYTDRWEGARNTVFTDAALGPPSQLREEVLDFKLYLATNFLGNNPATQELWQTQEVLFKLFQMKVSFMRPGTILREIAKAYLVEVDGLTSLRKRNDPTTRKLMLISCESNPIFTFDLELAVDVWRSLKTRKTLIADQPNQMTGPKALLKTVQEKSAGRKAKALRRIKNEHASY